LLLIHHSREYEDLSQGGKFMISRFAVVAACLYLNFNRVYAGEVYEVWGGNDDVTWGDVDTWSGYNLLGTSTSTAFFAGSYSNYVIATRSRVGVDAIMGADGTYGSQANQADPWWYSGFTPLYGTPDDLLYIMGYAPAGPFIHGQVSFKGNNWTGITVFAKDLPPNAPSVSISQGDYTNKISLTWQAVDDATGYKVARSTSPDYSSATNIYMGTSTNLVDTNVTDRVPFYYWVQATNGAGASLSGRGFLGYSMTPTGAATRLWTRSWGSTNDDYAEGLTVDRDGAIYVTGDTYEGAWDGQTNQGSNDGWLTKYTTNGVREWTRMWGSPNSEYVGDIAVDSTAGVYVVGSTYGILDEQTNTGWRNVFLIKYATNGIKDWTRMWGSTNHDFGSAVCLDSNNNVYVVGYTQNGGPFDGETTTGYQNAFLTKFSSAGARLWSRVWGETGITAYAVCPGVSNSLFVAGSAYSGFDGQDNPQGYGAFISRFLNDGTRLWSRILTNGPAMEAMEVVADSDGNAYVGGTDGISSFLAKYTPSGDRSWYHVQGLSYLAGLAYSATGELLALSENFHGTVRLTKISANGTELYVGPWSSSVLYVDDLACTPGGNIYLAGEAENSIGGQDVPSGRNPYLSKWVDGGFPLPEARSLDLTSGVVGGVVTGAFGADYSVEVSTNMQEWTTILVTNRPAMPFQWQDTNTPADRTFYRVQIGPP
jgi:hypothetical protein